MLVPVPANLLLLLLLPLLWRIPFLVTVFTTPIAVILRMHMPEPYEYLQSAGKMKLERVASTAAHRVAGTFSRQMSSQHSAGSAARSLPPRQLSKKLMSLTHVVSTDNMGDDDDACFYTTGSDHHQYNQPSTIMEEHAKDVAASPFADQDVSKIIRPSTDSAFGAPVKDAQAAAEPTPESVHPASTVPASWSAGIASTTAAATSTIPTSSTTGTCFCSGSEFAAEVSTVAPTIKHHVPIAVLFRSHWKPLLLQILMEAALGSSFYSWFSEAVCPWWNRPYSDQLSDKMTTVKDMLKQLTEKVSGSYHRNSTKPDWLAAALATPGKQVLPLPGIVRSPQLNGYRNKVEFSIGLDGAEQPTAGFLLGNFVELHPAELMKLITSTSSPQQLQEIVVLHQAALNYKHLSAAINGLAKMHIPKGENAAVQQLFGQLEQLLLPQLDQCELRQLSNTAWSCSKLWYSDSELFSSCMVHDAEGHPEAVPPGVSSSSSSSCASFTATAGGSTAQVQLLPSMSHRQPGLFTSRAGGSHKRLVAPVVTLQELPAQQQLRFPTCGHARKGRVAAGYDAYIIILSCTQLKCPADHGRQQRQQHQHQQQLSLQ
eukprot:gene12842-12969_t